MVWYHSEFISGVVYGVVSKVVSSFETVVIVDATEAVNGFDPST